MSQKSKTHIEKILEDSNLGIKLDLGCGQNKQQGFVGIDIEAHKGVDIVHDLELFPYPLPDECASFAVCSHLVEHINPHKGDPRLAPLIDLLIKKKMITEKEIRDTIGEYEGLHPIFIRFMDEVWRLLKTGSQFAMVFPYAASHGFWQDPTHLNGINEATFGYFDPVDKSGLWNFYKPLPWKIINSTWNVNGNMEVVLEKRVKQKKYLK